MPHTAQIAHYKNKLQYEIDAWDLHQSLENGDDVVVVDARSANAFQKEHIPGAMSFPHRTINLESAQAKLNPETLYVTYCDGIGCNASTKGALKLAELGYRVKELMGGIDWWKRDQYPTEAGDILQHDVTQDCGCG